MSLLALVLVSSYSCFSILLWVSYIWFVTIAMQCLLSCVMSVLPFFISSHSDNWKNGIILFLKNLQSSTLAFSVVSILLKSVFISISHFLPLSHLDKKNMNNELYASSFSKDDLVSSSLQLVSWLSELVEVENKNGRILIIWSKWFQRFGIL